MVCGCGCLRWRERPDVTPAPIAAASAGPYFQPGRVSAVALQPDIGSALSCVGLETAVVEPGAVAFTTGGAVSERDRVPRDILAPTNCRVTSSSDSARTGRADESVRGKRAQLRPSCEGARCRGQRVCAPRPVRLGSPRWDAAACGS